MDCQAADLSSQLCLALPSSVTYRRQPASSPPPPPPPPQLPPSPLFTLVPPQPAHPQIFPSSCKRLPGPHFIHFHLSPSSHIYPSSGRPVCASPTPQLLPAILHPQHLTHHNHPLPVGKLLIFRARFGCRHPSRFPSALPLPPP